MFRRFRLERRFRCVCTSFDAPYELDAPYDRSRIKHFIAHTGGPKVLEATADALGLKNGELDVSWDALRRVGNLSSASVLIVLDEVMKHRRPPRGTRSILAAMGPGFCAEILLLEW